LDVERRRIWMDDWVGWVKSVLCVYARVIAALEVDDAGADILLLALGCLALAVEVPDRLDEGLQDVGALCGESVVDVVGGGDV
jgi:hypothetical protein